MKKDRGVLQDQDIDLWGLVKWFWSRRISYIIFVITCAGIFAAYSYSVPKQYTAAVDLLPTIPVQKAGLLGPLASFTGEPLSLEGVDEELYGRVLHSNRVLDRVIDRKWAGLADGDSITLPEVFHLGDVAENKGKEFADHALKNILRFSVIRFDRDPMNGAMKIYATVPEYPNLAASLANCLADELESYNRRLNNQKTVKLRDFVASRLIEIQSKLEGAEEDLTEFLQNNQRYKTSPRLLQKYGELEREVEAYRTIWIQLRSKLENANIDVNKEIDSIKILDRASPPLHRSAPKRWIYLFSGAFVGFLLATGFGILRQFRG